MTDLEKLRKRARAREKDKNERDLRKSEKATIMAVPSFRRKEWYVWACRKFEKLLLDTDGFEDVRLGETWTWKITPEDIKKYKLILINHHFAKEAAFASITCLWRKYNNFDEAKSHVHPDFRIRLPPRKYYPPWHIDPEERTRYHYKPRCNIRKRKGTP